MITVPGEAKYSSGCAEFSVHDRKMIDPSAIRCPNATLALHVAKHSHCPFDKWHDRIANLLVAPTMVYINVGANKGYNLISFMKRYGQTNMTSRGWYHMLTHNQSSGPLCKLQCCGICNDGCVREKKPAPLKVRAADVRMHALEAAPANARVLKQLVALSRSHD